MKKQKKWADKLKGGRADDKKPSDFPKRAVKEGKEVEKEHTSDPHLQTEIALDHLKEDPKYYDKLKTIHKEPVKKAKEESSIPKEQKRKFRKERNIIAGTDQYEGQVTSKPGVSDRGIEVRRMNPQDKTYAKVGDPAFHKKRATSYFKSMLHNLQQQPKPNLPKSELEKARIDEGKGTEEKEFARSQRSKVEEKGVHQPESRSFASVFLRRKPTKRTEGRSSAGSYIEQAKTDSPRSAQQSRDVSKELHSSKLQELKGMARPRLPKTELGGLYASENKKTKNKSIETLRKSPMPPPAAKGAAARVMGWTMKRDDKNAIIHFNHPRHGTISVKPNANLKTRQENPYHIIHNGASVGKFKSKEHAAMGLKNYIRSLGSSDKPQTRMHNVETTPTKKQEIGTGPSGVSHPTPTLDPKKVQGFNQGFSQGLSGSQMLANLKSGLGLGKAENYFSRKLAQLRKDEPVQSHNPVKKNSFCPRDLNPTVNSMLETSIIRKLQLPRLFNKTDLPSSPSKPALDLADITGSSLPPVTPQHDSSTPSEQPTVLDQETGQRRSYDLLTDEAANAKTAKSGIRGEHLSAILHLAPADLAGGKDMCPFATEGCRHSCLNTSGRGGMLDKEYNLNEIQIARIRKTKQLQKDPNEFIGRLKKDIEKLKKYSQEIGRKPVVRLNGTSDVDWSKFKSTSLDGKNIFEAFPDTQFYDYTKNPNIIKNNKYSNYHVTFSLADGDKNQQAAKKLLNEGHNVAVVFGGKKAGKVTFPKTFMGRPVVSGDDHDLRFLDPKGGYIIGLSAKADAMHDTTGFVQWGHEGEPTAKPIPKNKEDMYSRIKGSSEEDVQKLKEKRIKVRDANKLLRQAGKGKLTTKLASSEKPQQLQTFSKSEPKKFVNVSQHWAARTRNPATGTSENPIYDRNKGHLTHLKDLRDLELFHGRPQHRFTDRPTKELGHETYEVGPHGDLRYIAAHRDTSD